MVEQGEVGGGSGQEVGELPVGGGGGGPGEKRGEHNPLTSRCDVEVERGHWYALGIEFINAGASWLYCVEDWAVREAADESRVLSLPFSLSQII